MGLVPDFLSLSSIHPFVQNAAVEGEPFHMEMKEGREEMDLIQWHLFASPVLSL